MDFGIPSHLLTQIWLLVASKGKLACCRIFVRIYLLEGDAAVGPI